MRAVYAAASDSAREGRTSIALVTVVRPSRLGSDASRGPSTGAHGAVSRCFVNIAASAPTMTPRKSAVRMRASVATDPTAAFPRVLSGVAIIRLSRTSECAAPVVQLLTCLGGGALRSLANPQSVRAAFWTRRSSRFIRLEAPTRASPARVPPRPDAPLPREHGRHWRPERRARRPLRVRRDARPRVRGFPRPRHRPGGGVRHRHSAAPRALVSPRARPPGIPRRTPRHVRGRHLPYHVRKPGGERHRRRRHQPRGGRRVPPQDRPTATAALGAPCSPPPSSARSRATTRRPRSPSRATVPSVRSSPSATIPAW